MLHALADNSNPFIALGVETRELSYSKAIAHVLFTNDDYLDALSRRLKLPMPLRFDRKNVRTEVPLGPGQRLDVLAVDRLGRRVVVETKVCAPIDLEQQARYVEAARETWPREEVVFLAYKLGPVLRREHVEQFALITSRELLEDLPPGDHMGLRPRMELFASMEERIGDDPSRVLQGEDAIDLAIRRLFAEPLYRRLFTSFCDSLKGRLVGRPVFSDFGVTARGGKVAQLFDECWLANDLGVQVHFELKDSERIALHVETLPYPSSDPASLAHKAEVVMRLQDALRGREIDGLKVANLRQAWTTSSSTTIATFDVSFAEVGRAIDGFSGIYNQSHALICEQFGRKQ